jgi:hypothetical protein
MIRGQASTSDARKRLADLVRSEAAHAEAVSGPPAQGGVIAEYVPVEILVLVREAVYRATGLTMRPGETYDVARALAAAGLLPARPEHEVKAEALREAAEINVAASPSFAAWLERFAARIESEAGGRP